MLIFIKIFLYIKSFFISLYYKIIEIKNDLFKIMNKIIEDYFKENDLNEEDLLQIFGSYIDISDEMGWRALTGVSYEDGQFIGWFIDRDGEEFDNYIEFTDIELKKIINYIKNKM